MLLITALVVGLGAGIAAVVFRYLILFFERIGFEWIPELTSSWGNAYVVFVPVLGGLLVGPLVYFFAPEAKGHGVPEVMEAVALKGGRIRPAVVAVKALASSICIGSGGSVGREGPIVQIGSALGSSVGQALGLSEERMGNLVACGAAAGIAATFNAPIAGVIFALEVILGGRFGVRYFSSVVVSAVAAGVVGRAAFGNVPAFRIPFEYGINSLWEYAFYPLLGLAAAFAGAGFTRFLYWSEDTFDAWRGVPEWGKPAVGGLLLGVLGLSYPLFTAVSWERTPQVFNVGYDVIEQALAGELTLLILATLFLLKIVATSLTLGSGGSGGVFAPALFMGAMLGGAFEAVVSQVFPGLTGPPGAYALVGMAAVFAAAGHAPITAVLILFELTGDYHIILPLMLTTVVATLVSQRLLGGESIYTLKLSRRGVRLEHGRDVDVLGALTVEQVMDLDVSAVPEDLTIGELNQRFLQRHKTGLLVCDPGGGLSGIVAVSDLERALEAGRALETPVKEIATLGEQLQVAFPDETMGAALARIGSCGIGRLPVVDRQNPRLLLGVIRRADILRAYQLALSERAGESDDGATAAVRSGVRSSGEFVSMLLDAGHKAAHESVQALASRIPADALIVAVERAGDLLIPHGSTRLQAGDNITVFVRRRDAAPLLRALQS